LRAAVPAGLVAAALPATLPLGRLLVGDVSSDTLALIPWLKVREHDLGPNAIRVLLLVGGLAAAALFLALSRRWAAVLPILLLGYFAAVLVAVEQQFRVQSTGALDIASRGVQPNWVDAAIGPGARAAAVWSQTTHPPAFWATEFFNRSVGPVYDLASPLPGDLPEHAIRPVATRYALADQSVTLAGVPVARSPGGEFTLYRTRRLRVLAVARGRYPGTDWYRPHATYIRYKCRGGSLTALVASELDAFPRGEIVAANGRRFRISSRFPRRLTVPFRPRGDRCIVRLRSRPVVVGQSPWGPPGKPVGAHYLFSRQEDDR
jgi:hypothetical protein